MEKVEQGDHVKVVYEGMLQNNEVFESSEEIGPLDFQVGSQSVLPGFEKAVVGMIINEEKTIQLQPEEAYGPKQEELIHTIKHEALGEAITPKVGMILGMTIERDGQKHKVPTMVTKITDSEVTVDFNHPLAGQVITYKITVKEINKESP